MTASEFLVRVGEMLIGRTDGPMKVRLVFQPTVAFLFALRAGLRDAREGRDPYLWSVFTRRARRSRLLREGWKDVGKVFIVAVVLDLIYEWIVYRGVYPGQAVIVAIVLAIVPYAMFRGLVTRIVRRRPSP